MNSRILTIVMVVGLSQMVISPASTAQRITVWWTSFGPSMEVDVIRYDLIPKFTDLTGIVVEFEPITGPDLVQRFAAGEGPDILLTMDDLGLSSAWHSFLIPLDPFLARWDAARFIPDWLLRRSHIDNQIFAMPIHSNLYGVYAYNKLTFAATGLDPSTPPQSWQDILEAITRTVHFDRAGLDMIQWTGEQTFVSYLFQNGGSMWTDDFSEIRFHRQEGVEALEFMVELFRANYPFEESVPSRLAQRIGFPQFKAKLINGDLAMFQGYSSSLSEFGEVEDIGYFLGRRSPAHEPVVIAEPYGLAISRFATNPIDAWRFIEFFFQPENAMLFHQATNTLATRLDLAEWVDMYTPRFRELYQYMSHAVLRPRLETASFNWYAHDQDWQKVFMGEISAEAALGRVGLALQELNEDLD